MPDNLHNEAYWNQRYLQQQTQWDIGHPSTPLKNYIDQLADKNNSILVPGCGNAYEAEYLLQNGFTNVTLIDISSALVTGLRKKFEGQPVKILSGDFFEHQQQYDLVLEQTFFCALHPSLRNKYVEKMLDLLKPGGKLAGVLFNRDFISGPPFGGTKEEYVKLFCPHFQLCKIEECYNSIPPRKGTEVFIRLQK